MTSAEHTQIVIALLTADTHGDELGGATILFDLSRLELIGVLDVAIGMLGNEIELGCKDAGYDVGEYLQLVALVNAREEVR